MDWNQRLLSLRELNAAPGPKPAGGLPARLARLAAHQESAWPELAAARDNWFACRYREIDLGPFSVLLQYNPVRELSVSAAVDEAAIRRRPCFLCGANMPEPERGLALDREFAFFLNPFPIFYPHPVAVHRDHRPQSLDGALPAVLAASRRLGGAYTMLYNGPGCGASAPDHLHFQAFPSGGTPLETDVRLVERPEWDRYRAPLYSDEHGRIFTLADYGRTVLVLQSADVRWLRRMVDRLVATLPPGPDGGEPLLNLVVWHAGGWTLCLFPRRRHRPQAYSTQPGRGVLVSPGSIDLAGLVITPRREDFEALNAERLRGIFAEVCLRPEELSRMTTARSSRRKSARSAAPLLDSAAACGAHDAVPAAGRELGREPALRVGLMEQQAAVEFRLDGPWRLAGRSVPAGWFHASLGGGHVRLAGPDGRIVDLGALPPMEPTGRAATFTIRGVTIGVDFHWQRLQDQSFPGALELTPDVEGGLAAVNRVPLEEYLACVIASEMRADAPLDFLRAHAVISRSWLLAQLEAARRNPEAAMKFPPLSGRILTWTDRRRHREFDVCADDHCQRYQGLDRVARPEVRQAVDDTRGLVLADTLGVVDARFSKCCGGMSEAFRSAWGDENPPSLKPVRDLWPPGGPLPDLTVEESARRWIETEPESFCGLTDPEILSRVLTDFDLETRRFYRWELIADARDLAAVIHAKSGWDPGELLEMIPVQRGFSGRLVRLLLVGTRGRLLVGKELEVRRLLSATHLYSSAFVVKPEAGPSGRPRAFRFRGAGWGHGVGLCQIGAAAMACRGFDHQQILGHYFPGSRLERWYS